MNNRKTRRKKLSQAYQETVFYFLDLTPEQQKKIRKNQIFHSIFTGSSCEKKGAAMSEGLAAYLISEFLGIKPTVLSEKRLTHGTTNKTPLDGALITKNCTIALQTTRLKYKRSYEEGCERYEEAMENVCEILISKLGKMVSGLMEIPEESKIREIRKGFDKAFLVVFAENYETACIVKKVWNRMHINKSSDPLVSLFVFQTPPDLGWLYNYTF